MASEMANTREYRETGGAGIGYSYLLRSNFTFPFARLVATESHIALSVLWGLAGKYEFDKGSIERISKCKGLISTGLRIFHTKTGYPPFIVFWTFSFDWLKGELERLGWEVEG